MFTVLHVKVCRVECILKFQGTTIPLSLLSWNFKELRSRYRYSTSPERSISNMPLDACAHVSMFLWEYWVFAYTYVHACACPHNLLFFFYSFLSTWSVCVFSPSHALPQLTALTLSLIHLPTGPIKHPTLLQILRRRSLCNRPLTKAAASLSSP